MRYCTECGEPMEYRGPVLHVDDGSYCTATDCVNSLTVNQEKAWLEKGGKL